MNVQTQNRVQKVTYFVCQHLFPEGPTEVQGLQHRVAVAGVAELEEQSRRCEMTWTRIMTEVSLQTVTGTVLETALSPLVHTLTNPK